MENFSLNSIVNHARQNGFKYLKGEYIATAKNEMVKDHFKKLGFRENDGYWVLDVTAYTDKKCFISQKNKIWTGRKY